MLIVGCYWRITTVIKLWGRGWLFLRGFNWLLGTRSGRWSFAYIQSAKLQGNRIYCALNIPTFKSGKEPRGLPEVSLVQEIFLLHVLRSCGAATRSTPNGYFARISRYVRVEGRLYFPYLDHGPNSLDRIKHPGEVAGKSTAVHARILSPRHVSIYDYPTVPDYPDLAKVVLVYPKEVIPFFCVCPLHCLLLHPTCQTYCVHSGIHRPWGSARTMHTRARHPIKRHTGLLNTFMFVS